MKFAAILLVCFAAAQASTQIYGTIPPGAAARPPSSGAAARPQTTSDSARPPSAADLARPPTPSTGESARPPSSGAAARPPPSSSSQAPLSRPIPTTEKEMIADMINFLHTNPNLQAFMEYYMSPTAVATGRK